MRLKFWKCFPKVLIMQRESFWPEFQEKICRSLRESNKKKLKRSAKQNTMPKSESLNMPEKFSCTLLQENSQSSAKTSTFKQFFCRGSKKTLEIESYRVYTPLWSYQDYEVFLDYWLWPCGQGKVLSYNGFPSFQIVIWLYKTLTRRT